MRKRIFSNASWIVGCKIVQSLISFVIGMITARYLGPSTYGLISYAASIVAFFQPLVKLGFDSTLVQEFICDPEKEGKILGTSIFLSLITSVASIAGIVAFVSVVNFGETETIIVCFLYSILLIFQACEMTQYWFQAKLLSKYSSIASLIAYVCVSVYKVYILWAQKDIRWFVVVHVIEVAIISFLLLILYKKVGGKKLSVSFALGKVMFSKSKYYILSGLMVVFFQQTDRIMLKLMVGETEIGYYSAAITCVGVTSFVFAAIIDSARPYVLEGYNVTKEAFSNRITVLFSIITYLSLLQCIAMTVFADLIVNILYGADYLPTINVMRILVWYITFGYYGMVRNIWILAEGKQKILIYINLAGAVLNIIGNMLLIPNYGACGAALASLITQIFTNFILCFIVKSMRPIGITMVYSLNPKYLLRFFKKK